MTCHSSLSLSHIKKINISSFHQFCKNTDFFFSCITLLAVSSQKKKWRQNLVALSFQGISSYFAYLEKLFYTHVILILLSHIYMFTKSFSFYFINNIIFIFTFSYFKMFAWDSFKYMFYISCLSVNMSRV